MLLTEFILRVRDLELKTEPSRPNHTYSAIIGNYSTFSLNSENIIYNALFNILANASNKVIEIKKILQLDKFILPI